MDYTDKETDYDLMTRYIKNTPVETLAILYNVKAEENPMNLFNLLTWVTISNEPRETNDRWLISFRVPSANRFKEEYTGTMNDCLIRIAVYMQWAKTDEGKSAIKKYLDH